MNFNKILTILILFTFLFIPINAFADDDDNTCDAFVGSTDNDPFQIYAFFDLRERESFIQVTYTDNLPGFILAGSDITIHVQIFNVDDNCNENNFFDTLTPTDTHVYNMRNIQTNNGSPSGVVLPENAYGIVVISFILDGTLAVLDNVPLVGNFRILDNSGYEYRTNMAGVFAQSVQQVQPDGENGYYIINFNQVGNVTLSDVVGISIGQINTNEEGVNLANITENFTVIDVDIFNNNEVPFSCRNIIFSCVDQDNPRLEELLEAAADEGHSASVASFEYGINEAIPHSKGGELLCPNNVIGEGFALLTVLFQFDGDPAVPFFAGYVGLNNGNGRGSMDSFWAPNIVFDSDGN